MRNRSARRKYQEPDAEARHLGDRRDRQRAEGLAEGGDDEDLTEGCVGGPAAAPDVERGGEREEGPDAHTR